DLDAIHVHMGLPWYVPKTFDGYTGSPTDIYFKEQGYDPNSIRTVGITGHELTHVRQFNQNGTVPFLLRYAWQAIWTGGYSHDIPFEHEAYTNAQNIRNDLTIRNSSGE